MKRLALIIVLGVVVGGLSFAEINLGDFPLGKWLDPNYNAVWEFSTGNIKIVSPEGKLYFDFAAATVENFKVGLEAGGATLTFSCKETGKTYKFTKSLTGMILEIDPPWKVHYKVTMKNL